MNKVLTNDSGGCIIPLQGLSLQPPLWDATRRCISEEGGNTIVLDMTENCLLNGGGSGFAARGMGHSTSTGGHPAHTLLGWDWMAPL